jgi:hypothetical protein
MSDGESGRSVTGYGVATFTYPAPDSSVVQPGEALARPLFCLACGRCQRNKGKGMEEQRQERLKNAASKVAAPWHHLPGVINAGSRRAPLRLW